MTSGEDTAGVAVSRWRWWIHLILIGGYVAVQIPLAFLRHPHRPALPGSVPGFLIVSTIDLALFALVFALASLTSRASREQLLLAWRPGWWVVPIGAAYSIAIRIVVAVVAMSLALLLIATHIVTLDSMRKFSVATRPDIGALVDVSAMQNDPVYFWLILTIGSFLVAGLREEMWRAGALAGMRALWPQAFAGRNGEVAAIVMIAVVFGAAHLLMGWLAAILAGILGIFLGLVMVVHRSVWPAVFAHGFFDAASFALLPYAMHYASHIR